MSSVYPLEFSVLNRGPRLALAGWSEGKSEAESEGKTTETGQGKD